ncbi:hypothetical protein [Streptomyces mutabilis]|uniref:hypothetical protein n=1 Tax=Streptomyces mutabilis TaxID=67332 RepID=UPI00178004C8|nr:hypothetical protein [Streptomyces mutabilis]GGQ19933.1 hypothetical protein GCM10010279_29750 [Streptomyces mutabilis]
MKTHKSDTRPPRHHKANSSLLRLAADILRLRYAHFSRHTGLSPTAAEKLANTLESIADGLPTPNHIDPREATALAHRLIDDDHPELSNIWPATRPTASRSTHT